MKYTPKEGVGMIVAEIDGKRYKIAKNHPTLPSTMELPKKLTEDEMNKYQVELADEPKKRKKESE